MAVPRQSRREAYINNSNTLSLQVNGRSYRLTRHAARRAAQAGYRLSDVAYILAHGRSIHRTGALFKWLGRVDIPLADRANARLWRLAGTVLVIEGQTDIVTAYHTGKRGLRKLCKKPKRRTAKYQRWTRLDVPAV